MDIGPMTKVEIFCHPDPERREGEESVVGFMFFAGCKPLGVRSPRPCLWFYNYQITKLPNYEIVQ